ncbi:MAG: transketolase [Spirochaetales bacterium]|nr:transketolase [Spirochaetales bacterium]
MGKDEDYGYWEKTKDIIDQYIDIMLNYRQSGHPGGSRSKVHALVSLLLGGAMRWDIRHPEKPLADRFVLGAWHTIPLIYATLTALNEALRIQFNRTGDEQYRLDRGGALYHEDLLAFRHKGGLSGHAEMQGKTLFLKFNTGPSGHGSPAAAGIALALKRAGAGEVKVFILEGEGGLTPGVTHETANSAWGLALDNLYALVDWNDFGIDNHPYSDVVYGTPEDWFSSHGWKVFSAEQGSQWSSIAPALEQMVSAENPERVPKVLWFKTRKGRGYGKYDNASHGSPHGMNSQEYWETKRVFAERYNVKFINQDGKAPEDRKALEGEFLANLSVVASVLRDDEALVEYLAGRLVELGDSVPGELPGVCVAPGKNPLKDNRLFDFRSYPSELYAPAGAKQANRAALKSWGAWVNAFCAKEYGRPVILASSADLAGSTNIDGFGEGWGDFQGYGWYERSGSSQGALLPQAITEFANAGIMTGIAATNLSKHPTEEFEGFWAATSTYGSFSYLVYGMLRLYSQLAQDCDYRTGKVIFVAGHSGPETADDSRTHFGIFSPGVTRLFPRGSVINLHPWEHNEVPVLLGTALKLPVPIVVLHLTRPPVEVPDRDALKMPSHFEAARGAYVVRDYRPGFPEQGTFYVQGTSAMANLVKILPDLADSGLNVKLVCVTSAELFALQDEAYRKKVVTHADRLNSTIITTQAGSSMPEFTFNHLSSEYAVSADWDNRWRTGGTLEEVLEEARLTPPWIMKGIQRFAGDRDVRLSIIRKGIDNLTE